jgi:prepilin-type N-terminal cleavage/methylation domain-containing protein
VIVNILGRKQTGLTLIEWLVVIAIIAILIIIVFAHINPLRERDRASDSRRKSDLDRIRIAMEDYYGDHDCYPALGPDGLFLCGGDTPDDFHPYLSTVPCDPDTGRGYFYHPEDTDCPSYYRMYTNLRWDQDPVISQVGCSAGCGPEGSYNYGVSSPNVGLEVWECPGLWYACQDMDGICECNVAGEECCYYPGEPIPPRDVCSQSWPIEQCFCNSDNCDGYDGKPMPY